MTWFATFQQVAGERWVRRLVVRGTLDVYLQVVVHKDTSGPRAARRYAFTVRFGDELLRTWNSMSLVCAGARTLLQFEMRVREGSSARVQALIDKVESRRPEAEGQRSIMRLVHEQAERDSTNVVVVFPHHAEPNLGWVPPVSPRHRGRALTEPQPWASVMGLGPLAIPYTLSHEVGHLLGLGEGYGDLVTAWVGSARLPARIERGTLPGDEGTPMALPDDAGPDANERQLQAIVGYAEAALAQGGRVGRYGDTVDHYRARQVG